MSDLKSAGFPGLVTEPSAPSLSLFKTKPLSEPEEVKLARYQLLRQLQDAQTLSSHPQGLKIRMQSRENP